MSNVSANIFNKNGEILYLYLNNKKPIMLSNKSTFRKDLEINNN